MDPQQQYCLKWNSFGSNLVTAFDSLFKSESLTDVTLFCEGVTFKAHRLILAACSKHFQDLFEAAPLTQSVIIILDGTSSSNMSALLEFMYKGEVHVSQEKLSSFLKAAEALQVKGLSIEHEKLAAAQLEHNETTSEETVRREDLESPTSRSSKSAERKQNNVTTTKADESPSGEGATMQPPSTSSYSPVFTYLPPYRTPAFEQRVPPSTQQSLTTSMPAGYDSLPRKRYIRSPSDPRDSSIRASVLQHGGSKPERESPISLSQFPGPPPSPHSHFYFEASDAATPFDRPAAVEANRPTPSPGNTHWPLMNSNCAEDLRVKSETPGESSENGNRGREKERENSPAAGSQSMVTWTSVQTTKELVLYKHPAIPKSTSSTSTPDGKKLQCPYCERLYGYETNLRAHIRQRHQGIRVPCPFCTRTFTRNNTVRRHIAREHKTELSLKALQQTTQVQNHNQ